MEKNYIVKVYSLDVILSVGYKVNSKRGILFRKWATKILSNYLMKGYAIDENRVTMYKENYIELNNTVLRLESKVDKSEKKINDVEIKVDNNSNEINKLKESKQRNNLNR